jgi:cation diffusion facilitator family transporter
MSSSETAATASGPAHLHIHVYDDTNPLAERRMRIVAAITAVMMLVEIGAGWTFNSMALLADGWHMSSHALALGLAAAAYAFARRLARDQRFAFGTWKIEVLGGYTSALFLVGVAAYMVFESANHLMHPSPIAFNEALVIAGIGLIVNIVSAYLLGGAAHHHHHGAEHSHQHAREHAAHDHDHETDHDPAHGEGHQPVHTTPHDDLNLRSAYIHVAADAATSVLAIGALIGGKFFGLVWLDPVMGFIGAAVVALWSVGLLRSTGRVLLDAEMDAPVVAAIRRAVRDSEIPAQIQDLHVWRVSRSKYACLLSVACDSRATPEHFRSMLATHEELVHVTVEVNHTSHVAARRAR